MGSRVNLEFDIQPFSSSCLGVTTSSVFRWFGLYRMLYSLLYKMCVFQEGEGALTYAGRKRSPTVYGPRHTDKRAGLRRVAAVVVLWPSPSRPPPPSPQLTPIRRASNYASRPLPLLLLEKERERQKQRERERESR